MMFGRSCELATRATHRIATSGPTSTVANTFRMPGIVTTSGRICERMNIRPATDADWNQMWPIFRAVIATGTTYDYAAETREDEARPYWLTPGTQSFVAEDAGRIVGMYRMAANRRALGSHVANASFMVDPTCQGRRIGEALCRDCLRQAKRAGF